MKAAWIGVLGAVAGAVLTVIGQPIIEARLHGPPEALFDVDVRAIGAAQVNPEVRDQVTEYPVFVRIAHVDGPAAKGISVTIRSEQQLKDVVVQRQDDAAIATLSPDAKEFTIDLSVLRKAASNEYRITSLGDPKYSYSVTMVEGRLRNDPKHSPQTSWYQTDVAVLCAILIVVIALVAITMILARRIYGSGFLGAIANPSLLLIGLLCALLSVLPLFGGLVIVVPLALVLLLERRLAKLEETTTAASNKAPPVQEAAEPQVVVSGGE